MMRDAHAGWCRSLVRTGTLLVVFGCPVKAGESPPGDSDADRALCRATLGSTRDAVADLLRTCPDQYPEGDQFLQRIAEYERRLAAAAGSPTDCLAELAERYRRAGRASLELTRRSRPGPRAT
jgi:hypothetical protein